MRVSGRFGQWDVTDEEMGSGGAATLFRCAQREWVYKQYHRPISDPADIARLWRMIDLGRPAVVGQSRLGTNPYNSINWPIDAIEVPGGASIRGVIVPEIPHRFRRNSGKPCTLDWLLLARTDPPRAVIRLEVVIRLAEVFAFLNGKGLVHGDLSARNVVWCESPEAGAYLIDCDGLRERTASGKDALITPDWTDPRRWDGLIPAHDHYSDWYALALVMYRGLLLNPGNLAKPPGSPIWPKPAALPAALPTQIKALFDRALGRPLEAKRRPAPAEWVSTLSSTYVTRGNYDTRKVKVLDDHADKNRRAHEFRRNAGTTSLRPPRVVNAPQPAVRPPSKVASAPRNRRGSLLFFCTGLAVVCGVLAVLVLPKLSRTPAVYILRPMGVAAAQDGKRVYVSSNSTNVEVVDPQTGRVTSTITLTCGGEPDRTALGDGSMAIVPAGRYIYVANRCPATADGGIHVIDRKADTVTRFIRVPPPGDMVLSHDQKRLYAASYAGDDSQFIVINVKNGEVLERVTVPYASHVALTPDQRRVYVARFAGPGPETVEIDTRTMRVRGVPTDEPGVIRGLAMSPNGKRLYIGSTANGILVINTKTNAQLASIPVDGLLALASAPDGKHLYALVGGPTAGVRVIDPKKNRVTAAIPITEPEYIAVASDGRRLYVGTPYGLVMIDTATESVIDPDSAATPTK
ncbi:hypothetical protein Acor_13900 [Acrocarpospora corrugata]|uniref:Protein kinase domain-containing protein n=1 Tax=Acrocarpospora corrugata TaxID=35763 RepID=A0A5M3VR95_9ACTN|nr:hypothetical protein [Acrocarpospora corrugata]GER99326.1 hypothetical protein Acor_13900 [Acrocarpospora corrugata]